VSSAVEEQAWAELKQFYVQVGVLQCWRYSGVTVVSQWYRSGVTVMVQWCYSGGTVVLQWCESVSSAVGEQAWAELKQFYVQVTPPHHHTTSLQSCT
jgi:hypothetical protein